MAVLITGGAGFIGSHITDLFIQNGYEVVIVDNLCTGKKENINPKAKFYHLDIRSNELEKVFTENNIELVLHQAAQASVGKSFSAPEDDLGINVCGSLKLFLLAKKYNVKKVIVASTAAVYGKPQYLPVDEKHPVDLLSYYGLSKYTMENYLKMSGIDYVIFRYSNVYGPRQDCEGEAGVVAIFIDKMTEDKEIQIHGDGEQTRDFICVDDIAKANLLAVQTDVRNETLNLSTNMYISVNKLYETIKITCGSNSKAVYTEPRFGDIKDSVLDNSKAVKLLNWKPEVILQDGLKDTVNWKKSVK